MQQEVKALNGLIETISQKMIDKTINDRYLISRMAVIVNEFDETTNSASVIIPTDLQHPTTYKYPNRTGCNKLNSTVWENGNIKVYGDKVYLIYQTNNISQGWLEINEPLNVTVDYNELTNKPSINGVTISGNKTSDDFYLQDKLVSGTNIKTINNNSLLGSGNIAVQDILVSGTNIKTINNNSILGSGNINIDAGTKFVKGQAITLYDTDGTTPLHQLLPENILFYDGSQGSSDLFNYNSLNNKPSINGVTLIGNKTTDDLGIISKFVKGTPIDLYDTDGETILYSRNPENLVFYDSGSGDEVSTNYMYASPASNLSLPTAYTSYWPTLTENSKRGSGFEIASNGDVLCTKSGKVRVTVVADVRVSNATAIGCQLMIAKNRVGLAPASSYAYAGWFYNMEAQWIGDVVAGDTFNMRLIPQNNNSTTSLSSQSSILCEYVEDYYITRVENFPEVAVHSYNTTTSATNSATQNKYWKVVGDGIVFVSVSMNSDSTSDTGSMRSYIYLNGSVVAINGNRFVSATSEVQACNASIALQVSDGDKIRAQQVTTKNGSKTFYWNVLAMGCAVTETSS